MLENFKDAGVALFLTDETAKKNWEVCSRDSLLLKQNIKRLKTYGAKHLTPDEQTSLDKQLSSLHQQQAFDSTPEAMQTAAMADTFANPADDIPVMPQAMDNDRIARTTHRFIEAQIASYQKTLDTELATLVRLKNQADHRAKQAGFVWDDHIKGYTTPEGKHVDALVQTIQSLRNDTLIAMLDKGYYKGVGLGFMGDWSDYAQYRHDPAQSWKVVRTSHDGKVASGEFTEFCDHAMTLNSLGYVLKEQCLSTEQLVGYAPNWINETESTTREQLLEIALDASGKNTLQPIGWYPCQRLLAQLQACVKKELQDLTGLLGDKANQGQGNPVQSVLEPLLKREIALQTRMASGKRWPTRMPLKVL